MTRHAPQGRPPATTHAAIEQAAFALFESRGFEATTMDDIAAALGIARRSLFRYYPSKNDILWGQFDETLLGFERTFADIAPTTALHTAVREAIIAFNQFDEAAIPQHRQRMRLLLGTPALVAHSELRYAAWREVVAREVARRLGCSPTDLRPTLIGRSALAIALTAYEQWIRDDSLELSALITQGADALGEVFSGSAIAHQRH